MYQNIVAEMAQILFLHSIVIPFMGIGVTIAQLGRCSGEENWLLSLVILTLTSYLFSQGIPNMIG
jgi:hypothetical protein